MNETAKLGPIHLAEGVTKWNARTYLFSAFCTIGFLSWISFIQGYVLNQNLHLPTELQGAASGNLSFFGELVVLTLSPFFGALSDKIGRRPIYALGFAWIGAGFALYPLATSLNELIAYRMFFAVGTAMLGGMMATVLSDYPQNRSRGLMAAASGWANGLGALTSILILGKLPEYFQTAGYDPATAGRLAFWTATVLCLGTAMLVFKGLKAGKPGAPKERVPLPVLVREGLSAARANPRIGVAYAESFIARGDLLMIGTFLALWATQAGIAEGLDPAKAASQASRYSGLVQGVTLLWAPIFGIILDRFDRATCVVIAMALAVIGYGSVGLLDNPLHGSTLALVLLGIGEFSAIMAGQALVAQEAPEDVRGSVLGLFAFFGALGLLVLSKAGGALYSGIGPGAPFLLIAGVNGVILLAAAYARIKTGYRSPKA